MDEFEFFGNETQVNLQKRYYRLWPYLKKHLRLSFVGRAIGIDDVSLNDVEELAGLIKELGFLSLAFTKPTTIKELCSALEDHGLETGIWHHLVSTSETESRCQSVVASNHPPAGYHVERISTSTPPHRIRQVQQLMQNCGVAPLPGYILRGQYLPTVVEIIVGAEAEVVATGAGIFRHNPEGSYGKAAHVGFLATDSNHRSRGFSRMILARIINACYEDFGAELVHTGVRPDNVPSQRVCHICGLEDSGMFFLGVSSPQIMKPSEFTC